MRVLLRGVENIVDILAAAVKVHLIGLHSHVGDGGKTIAGGQLIALGRDAAKLQCVAYGGQHVVQLHVGGNKAVRDDSQNAEGVVQRRVGVFLGQCGKNGTDTAGAARVAVAADLADAHINDGGMAAEKIGARLRHAGVVASRAMR